MNWKIWLPGAAVFLALATASYSFKTNEITFTRLIEAKTRLANLGYHCTTDTENGKLGCGFLISRQAVPWHEVSMLCKTGVMGSEWDGKVWVTLNPSFWRLEAIPDQAGVRVWGAVIAFGDDELLDEIDDAL